MPGTSRPALRTSVRREGSTAIVSVAGELDLATAEGLRSRLSTVVAAKPPPERLVLDLAELEFVDASGISALLHAQRALAARGGVTELRSPSRLVRRVVRVLQLEKALPVER